MRALIVAALVAMNGAAMAKDLGFSIYDPKPEAFRQSLGDLPKMRQDTPPLPRPRPEYNSQPEWERQYEETGIPPIEALERGLELALEEADSEAEKERLRKRAAEMRAILNEQRTGKREEAI